MRLSTSLALFVLAGVPLAAFALSTSRARAAEPAVVTKELAYEQGGVACKGWLARPAGDEKTLRPGVLVVHDWIGRGPFAKERAEQLAEAGYVALALDMYGGGKVASGPEEAQKLATTFYKDRALMVARAKAGLDLLLAQPGVDAKRVAAIGFCFGGSIALQLARSGADLAGVVSFHGGLKTDAPAEEGAVKASILVLHGGEDPYVPPAELAGFLAEMNAAGARYRCEVYGGAVHAFTNPAAGADNSKGAAFNVDAARRSRAAQDAFFGEIFQPAAK